MKRALLLAFACLLSAPALAQDDLLPESDSERLERLNRELEAAREKTRALSGEEAELSARAGELRRKLVETASEIQAIETELTALEREKWELERREQEARAGLDLDRERLVSLVAVLQLMSRTPPPALLVSPDDATRAARSAMLLQSLIPGIEEETEEFRGKLVEITNVRREIARRGSRIQSEAAALDALRRDAQMTLAELEPLIAQNRGTLALERARLRALGEETETLSALINRLTEERAGRVFLSPYPGGPTTIVSDEAGIRRPLTSLRGTLPWPAAGEVVSRFGAALDHGEATKGLIIATRSGAQVVSPIDGRIEFADVYKGYGNLLIISGGEGYHFLLSGLARIDGVIGQWVIAGEPVGVMGQGPQAEGAQDARPPLYVELQKAGRAVDPLPWFVSRREERSAVR